MLAFNIAQFFPLLNHQLLPLILDKTSLNHKILLFFRNYLVCRKTKYLWNSFSSPFFNINIGVEQGSAFSSILSTLYLLLIFHILEKYLKNLKIPISILLFIDDGLLSAQNKSIRILNTNLYCSYNIISSLISKFKLVIKHGKTEVFYFSRLRGAFNTPPLDLTPLGGSILHSKSI